jgi:SAM-dependent methyltransferase
MSDFEVNGLLDMYPMHLLTTAQWSLLLAQQTTSNSLLDVGAGNGDLTQALAPLFREVTVTEQSSWMRRRLQQRGFKVGPADLDQVGVQFDVVTCLNVLDRTPRPVSLFRSLARRLNPGGRLVVSVPLPSDPFFYDGPRTRPPLESLNAGHSTFEQSAEALVATLHRQCPTVSLTRFSRRPYLSGGDRQRPYYSLDSGVFVFGKPSDRSERRTGVD